MLASRPSFPEALLEGDTSRSARPNDSLSRSSIKELRLAPAPPRMGHDTVELWVDAKNEMPGERFLRALAALRAKFQVVIDGVVERLDHLRDGIPLEGDPVAEADHMPEEDTDSSSNSTTPV